MFSQDVIGQEVQRLAERFLTRVKRTGSENLMAACPFHTRADGSPERHPSFAISLVTGLYFCHSCKEKGNLRQFLQAMQVAPVVIRNEYGILLDAVARYSPKPRNPTQCRCAIDTEYLPNSFLGLFDYIPVTLLEDGFTEQTLSHFEVGFDSYHQRVTFPLRDMQGNLLGISGRSVDPNAFRRFKVYDREYAQWRHPNRTTNMADVIWNLHNVYAQTYRQVHAPLVAVEGFKACMWVHQAGFPNVIALCGSYLKEGQQWLLEHLGPEVYLMLDNDKAGRDGTTQAAEALYSSLPTNIVSYRESAKQPTDLRPEEIRCALDSAQSYIRWKTQRQVADK